jgi:hypothetical protein
MNHKVFGIITLTIPLFICVIATGLSLVESNTVYAQIFSLAFLFFPGYLVVKAIKSDCKLDAHSLAISVIISICLLVSLSLLSVFLFKSYLGYIALLNSVVTFAFVISSFKILTSSNRSSQQTIELDSDKKALIVLILLAIIAIGVSSTNTSSDRLADNDSYTYVSLGKTLFTQGPSAINWPETKVQAFGVLSWNAGNYQPIYVGIDRLGFILIEGAFGEIAGHCIPSGTAIAIFFYALLPLCTYLVAGLIMRKRSSLIAACLVVFIPYIVWHSNRVLTEISMTVFALLSIYFITQYLVNHGKGNLLFFFITFLCSLFIKPMAVFLIIPFIILITLYRFKVTATLSRANAVLWVILWSVPFIGSMFLTRFRTSGSFRLLLSSLVNVFAPSSSAINSIQNNFSPAFLTPTILVFAIIGIPYVVRKLRWKTGLTFLISVGFLTLLISAIGLLEPREAIIVYPLLIIPVASFFDSFNLKLTKSLALAYLLMITLLIFLFFSITGPIYLQPGFEISQTEFRLSILLSMAILLLLFVPTLFNTYIKALSKIASKYEFKNVIVLICVFLIALQGLIGSQALIQGGVWSNISLSENKLIEISNYLNNVKTQNSSLMTTLMASEPLNYLTSIPTLQPPPTLADFYRSLQNGQFDYLVLTPQSSVLWVPSPDYFQGFLLAPPEGMHEVYKSFSPVLIYSFSNSNQISSHWQQYNAEKSAYPLNGSLVVGGLNETGLVSNDLFPSKGINITCSMYSLSSSYSPQLAWSNGPDYIATYYRNNAWVIESSINGTVIFTCEPGEIKPNALFNLTLSMGSDEITVLVNGKVVSSQHYLAESIKICGHIILRSTNSAAGEIMRVSVYGFPSVLIYARND